MTINVTAFLRKVNNNKKAEILKAVKSIQLSRELRKTFASHAIFFSRPVSLSLSYEHTRVGRKRREAKEQENE